MKGTNYLDSCPPQFVGIIQNVLNLADGVPCLLPDASKRADKRCFR